MAKQVLIHVLVQLNLLIWLSAFGYVACHWEGSELFYLCLAGVGVSAILEHVYYRHLYRPWKDRRKAPDAAGPEYG